MTAAPGISIKRHRWAGPDGPENGLLLRQGDRRLFLPAPWLRAFSDYAVDAAEHYEAQEDQE